MKIELQHISKQFGQENIFRDFSYHFLPSSSTALLGNNGSGKSTLLQIIAGYANPTKGTVNYILEDKKIEEDQQFQHVTYCAPYLELVEEMTLMEFLQYHFSFKKSIISVKEIVATIGLEKANDKLIGNFSSGMKQRVKLAQAICATSPVVLLDEPCTNLDQAGIDLYHQMIATFCKEKILIVASNDPNEYDVCKDKLYLHDFKK